MSHAEEAGPRRGTAAPAPALALADAVDGAAKAPLAARAGAGLN